LQHGSAEFAQGVLKKILGFKGTAVKNCFSRSFLKSIESENRAVRPSGVERPHSKRSVRRIDLAEMGRKVLRPCQETIGGRHRRNEDWCGASEIMGWFAWMRIRIGLRGESG
jgi:hypothetical protein